MSALRNALHVVNRDYHKFETDPRLQLAYHRRMTIFWICNLPFILVLVILNIRVILSGNGTKLAILLDAIMFAINTLYSLYALICTEMGDAHSAYASVKAQEIADGQTNTDFVRSEPVAAPAHWPGQIIEPEA